LGINLFDTANSYQGGRAEEVLGKALAIYPHDTYFVATKVYDRIGGRPNDAGLSRKHIMSQVDASLRRLGLDYIDLYQCHRYDRATPLEETCRAMDDLISRGRIIYWGVSEWNADQLIHVSNLCRSAGWSPPVSNQPQYSALWRGIEHRILPTALELGMGTLAWSPLAMGVLTGKYTSSDPPPAGSRATTEEGAEVLRRYMARETLEAMSDVNALARDVGCTTPQLALAWCLRQPGLTAVLTGASRLDHVDENAAAADLDVPDEVFERLGRILAPVAVLEEAVKA
jgi:aryl-alcohol dehydrogenase-like predicted oxidoreductase